MKKDILLCGIGGQGTVLSAKILAAAAMEEGNIAHSAETIGMAQRGGSVTSHVRIGQEAFSPLIPYGSADLLLAFEPAEAVRNLKYLRRSGIAIVNTTAVMPAANVSNGKAAGYDSGVMTEYLKKKCRCILADSVELCKPFGSSRYFNIIILGIASGSDVLGIDREAVLSQIEEKVPKKYIETNKEAFLLGYETGSAKRL
ncbi:MAG: indolepyruvate oxidoreductase subunit beta [Lachnospiraceae bacterium]|nr:indolepyruvate oxidoreductase subunit beta [Lachnospiraceae bacterium]